MDRVVPWRELCAVIEPVYPNPGKGCSPVGLERMLRIYVPQQWFNLSDPGAEEALYDSLTMRRFAGIDLGREPVPDETTLCKFRHLLERHELGSALFQRVHEHLEQHVLKLSRGTIVDATIIHAPSSTKNAAKARDPVLLEPIDRVSVLVPNEFTARAQRLLTGRRGQILGYAEKPGWPGWDEVEALVPQAELQDFIIELRSQTMGLGTYRRAFDHLAESRGEAKPRAA
jgi:hypothetical protein